MSTRNARRRAKKNQKSGSPPATTEAVPATLPWERARDTLGRQLLRTQPAPDGHVRPMCVVRPRDPEKALRLAKEALANSDVEGFASLPEIVGTLTFLGYLTVTGYVADARGEIVGNVQRGDSFLVMQEERPIGEEFVIPVGTREKGWS